VEYVIIGATAFPIHGYARATLDIDLFIRPEVENVKRVMEALKDFGYDLSDLTIDDFSKYKILIRQYLVETDIHPFVTGITFNQVWENKVSGTYKSVPVFYASLEDIITMKEATGRNKDLEDLKILKSLISKT
jgi:predicted nucleotidyltransferase